MTLTLPGRSLSAARFFCAAADWNSLGLNGLGNSLEHYARALLTGALAGRAPFSLRNRAQCGADAACVQVDPGRYFGAPRGAAAGGGVAPWRWSARVADELTRRGVNETFLQLDEDSVGFVDHASGLRVPGGLDLMALLAHPDVAPRPWVRVQLPSGYDNGTRLAVVNALWAAGVPGAGGVWGGLMSARLADALNARLAAQATEACPVAARRKCGFASFLFPLPAFQRTLEPYVRRLDEARAAGAAAVAVHVRSGYADHVAMAGAVSGAAVKLPAAAAAAAGGTLHAQLWARLNAAYTPCADAAAADAATAEAPCVAWSPAAAAGIASGGASCGAAADSHAAASGAATPAAFNFGDEVVPPGPLSSFVACAASRALRDSANATSSSSLASPPWLIYVAGDLPPLFLLANASAALAGHVLTAEGALGHASSSTLCRVAAGTTVRACAPAGEDPGGAWTRAMLDVYMLGACDILLRLGSSSFPGAALVRVFPTAAAAGARAAPPPDWSYDARPSLIGFQDALSALADDATRALEEERGAAPPPAPPPAAPPAPPDKVNKGYVLLPGECLVAQAATWGLGSQLVHLAHAMVHVPADKLYWDFGPSPYTCCPTCDNNGWSELFEGAHPTPVPRDAKEVGAYFAQRTMAFVDPSTRREVRCKRWWTLSLKGLTTKRYNASEMCPGALCAAMARLWRYSPAMQAVLDYELANLALYPPPLVVLQVRGGDKVGDEVEPYTLHAGIAALAADAGNRNGTCVVLGDDDALGRNASALARAALGCHVHYRIHPGHAHFQGGFAAEPLAERCQRTKQLLVDIEIIAAAKAFAGLIVSNVVRIGVLLRACRHGGAALGNSSTVDWQMRDVLQEACLPA
jgi:hypothetical protein